MIMVITPPPHAALFRIIKFEVEIRLKPSEKNNYKINNIQYPLSPLTLLSRQSQWGIQVCI